MSNQKIRRKPVSAEPTPFEQARDELFQHIMQCEVIGAASEHQDDWFRDTMRYFSDRFPELDEGEIDDLRTLGARFAQPPKVNDSTDGTPTGAASAA
ncbi:MAG: hypothetical protein ACRENI_11585 [Gemmatimonadaceae bacterium]